MDAPDLVLASISMQIMCEFMGDAMLTIVAETFLLGAYWWMKTAVGQFMPVQTCWGRM
jgi:hypothetical protein